jgi:hypothetical protein
MGAHRALGGYCYSPSIDQSVKSKDDENWREPKGFFKLQTKEHGDALRLRRERLISRIIFEYLSVQLNAQQYYFKKKKKTETTGKRSCFGFIYEKNLVQIFT